MTKLKVKSRRSAKIFPLCLLSLAVSNQIHAQENIEVSADLKIASPVEEVMVVGRLQSGARELIVERMESENVVDILGAEQMSRIGDSNIAVALKRVPGITLVDGKFVYIRGLGERYITTNLNGATVPSPDLTRSVLPLDIFPTSIVESIAIQKTFSADTAATFGGGNINIRTKGIPDGFVFGLEFSGGMNSISDEQFSYSGGGDDSWGTDDGTRALSSDIDLGLRRYRTSLDAPEGSVSPTAIQATYAREGSEISLAEAAAINADLATQVYRDLDINEESGSIHDSGAALSVGSLFEFGSNWAAGFLVDLGYDTQVRSQNRLIRAYADPESEFSDEDFTVNNVSITGAANFGLRWGDEHIVESKNLFLRNTDDEVSINDIYNQTVPFEGAGGYREYSFSFEERELELYQFEGSHTLGYESRELLGLGDSFLDDLSLTWFYSDAEVTTDIPSETTIQASTSRVTGTDEILSTSLRRGQRMFQVGYTELVDTVESSGFEVSLPISAGAFEWEFSGGGKYDRKLRSYSQLDMSIGTTSSAADGTFSQPISEVFSDENLTNPDYSYELIYQDGLSRSYIAATTTDAMFGEFDVFWDETLRFVVGARYETYSQFSAPWQPYRVNGSQVRVDYSDFEDGEYPDGTFKQDDVFGTMGITYVAPGFLADDYQLRFIVSETTVRPDLREVSPTSFKDPRSNRIIEGNPETIPSDILNIDLRNEWTFSGTDSLTVSLFYKDIENPIEYFDNAGAEDTITSKIHNAESGKVQGIEAEFMKNLEFMGGFASQFYVSGNLTVADSEISVGDSLTVAATNRTRPLQGASEYVVNTQLGYDSDNGQHAATLVYNVFGPRVASGGIGGEPDIYEEPFSAVDLSYFYYPTDSLTVKLTAKNILNENVEFSMGDIVLQEQTVGVSYGLSLKYAY